MQQLILAQGMFPLTQEAADAALDAIDFIAAAVRGYDAIDVTNIVRPLWRTHLASCYPQLPPPTQLWYANASQMLASIRAQWPLLDPWRRSALLQQWAIDLPHMLWMVDPVLAQAQAIEMQQAHRLQLEELRRMADNGRLAQVERPAPVERSAQVERPARIDQSAHAKNELNRGMQSAIGFQNFTTQMTASTLNLTRAMSGGRAGWSAR